MKKAISLRLDEDILGLVDKVAKNSGWNRTMVIEQTISMMKTLIKDSDIPLEEIKKDYVQRIMVNSYLTAIL